MSLPPVGTHLASIGERSLYYTKNGALCWSIQCLCADGASIVANSYLVKKDGTVNTRTVETVKHVFGWDGQDFDWLLNHDLSQVGFEIVVQDEQDLNGHPRP
jgi:hypothetical protein